MRFLYNLSVWAYRLAVTLAASFNPKAALWVKGRKNLLSRLDGFNPDNRPVIWFHAASLGEFEQGRPVMEEVRKRFPNHFILLTFFSPSGYEVRKNYEGADYICYLPADTPRLARQFIDSVNPVMALFVKYEFWFNYMRELHIRNIPLLSISTILRPSQHFFKWYGSWFRKQLQHVSWFFVQDNVTLKLLSSVQLKEQCSVSGDTRFDRVAAVAQNARRYPAVEKFCGKSKVVLAGSSWPADEALLAQFFSAPQHGLKLVIAPHEIHENHLKAIESLFPQRSVRLSEYEKQLNAVEFDVLIVDSIGKLLHLYQYAYMAFIGGGFGKGIHNILEAATFGVPVLFGPQYRKFNEAVELVEAGGAFCFCDFDTLKKQCSALFEDDQHRMASETCRNYVNKNGGAATLIMEKVASYL